MTIPPIPLRPMVWHPWEHGIARANSALGEYCCWPGHFRPPGQMRGIPADDPQAAAEAHYVAVFNAWIDPARLKQWAAGVLLADAMACLQLGENVTDGEAAMLRFMDTLDKACVINALQVLAGKVGQ
jgi:hypothetical protein